ncbi:MAG: hypothetical protein ABFS14_07170 [Gemmatimonadota bacterium]
MIETRWSRTGSRRISSPNTWPSESPLPNEVVLSVDEVEALAESFESRREAELFSAASGRKGWPELAPLYEGPAALAPADTLPAIQTELAAEQTAKERRRLEALRGWVARHHARRAAAPFDDEHAAWSATATVTTQGGNIPVRELPDLVAGTADRAQRAAIEAMRMDAVADVSSLFTDRYSAWKASSKDLGYGSATAAAERTQGVNLDGLRREAGRFLDDTDDMYRHHLAEQLSGMPGAQPGHAATHDAARLARTPWLDSDVAAVDTLDAISGDLTDIGLSLEAQNHVTIHSEWSPEPWMRPFCAPRHGLGEVALLVTPIEKVSVARQLLRAIGRAIHYAWLDPRCPFALRALGDPSVAEAHTHLWADLASSAHWVGRVWGLRGDRRDSYLRQAAFLDLHDVRRLAARLEFALAEADTGHPEGPGESWSQLMRTATGFAPDPREYLEYLSSGIQVAFWLRGRMLAAQLGRELRDRHDEDWYRNPRAGAFLSQWLLDYDGQDAGELAVQLGDDRLSADALLTLTEERLA